MSLVFLALAFFAVAIQLAAVQEEERWRGRRRQQPSLLCSLSVLPLFTGCMYSVLFTGLLEEKVRWEEGRREDKLRLEGNLCPLGHCKANIHPFTPLGITVT